MLHPHQLKVPMMSTLNENIDSPKPPFPGKNRQALAEDSHIAAFFDLDKTILATASAMALSSPLVHAGVMSRWDSLRATIVQLPYLFTGADDDRMRSMMHALGELTRGWDPQYVEKIVNSVTSSSIAPLCYRQALALIDHHRLLGHHVVIASASPMEIVRPIAHLLSIPDALSTIVGRGQDGLVDGTITPIPFRIYPCLSLSAIPKPSTLIVPLPQSPANASGRSTLSPRPFGFAVESARA